MGAHRTTGTRWPGTEGSGSSRGMDSTMQRNMHFILGVLVVPLALLGVGIVYGGSRTPHTFVAGTPVVAADVNANFAAHEAAFDYNSSRLDALEQTPPPVPSFSASVSAEFLQAGSNIVVVFDVEGHDNGGVYDHTTGTFSAPRDGVYHFSVVAVVFTPGKVKLQRNGTIDLGAIFAGNAATLNDPLNGSIVVTVALSQGDTVTVWRDTADLVGTASGTPYTTFSGFLIQDG